MIVIECDRCKLQMTKDDEVQPTSWMNLRIHDGPGTTEARGHLCMSCVQWLIKELHNLPVVRSHRARR
jgi:hypothetical protein